jgi:hypothetical protein
MFGAKLVHFLFMVLLFMQCTTFKVLTNVIINIYIIIVAAAAAAIAIIIVIIILFYVGR